MDALWKLLGSQNTLSTVRWLLNWGVMWLVAHNYLPHGREEDVIAALVLLGTLTWSYVQNRRNAQAKAAAISLPRDAVPVDATNGQILRAAELHAMLDPPEAKGPSYAA